MLTSKKILLGNAWAWGYFLVNISGAAYEPKWSRSKMLTNISCIWSPFESLLRAWRGNLLIGWRTIALLRYDQEHRLATCSWYPGPPDHHRRSFP